MFAIGVNWWIYETNILLVRRAFQKEKDTLKNTKDVFEISKDVFRFLKDVFEILLGQKFIFIRTSFEMHKDIFRKG